MKRKKLVLCIIIIASLWGCTPLVKLEYPYPPIAYQKSKYKVYIDKFVDMRPKIEKKGSSFIDLLMQNDPFMPLPEVRFKPEPPAEFLRKALVDRMSEMFEIVSDPDSADFSLELFLNHLSIRQVPSTALKILCRSTLMLETVLIWYWIAPESFESMLAEKQWLWLPLGFSVGALGSMLILKMDYESQITVDLKIKDKEGTVISHKELSRKRFTRLPMKSQMDTSKELNILIKEIMDKMTYHLSHIIQ
ncbi:hypothetical protein KAW50_01485 [candidate division WOR-3 bacterium]|nr:hypothetical protein [candidate division WOR-3 bacterium]